MEAIGGEVIDSKQLRKNARWIRWLFKKKGWVLVLPWVVAVSTSLPFREGQVTTYPMVYGQAIETLACPNDKNHCLWVQDFVEAMNEAHEKRARDSYNSAPHHSISVDNR